MTRRPSAKAPPITLVDLLLLGAPDGKTEMLDGRVWRMFLAADATQARTTFAGIARELTEREGAAWHDKIVAHKDEYSIGRFHLTIEDKLVGLDTKVGRALWDEFCRG